MGGENVADLAGANPKSHGPEGTVGRGVRIAAGDGRAGLGDALFGSDDVDDALLSRRDIEKGHPEVGAIFAQLLDHRVGEGVLEGFDPLVGRDDMVDGGKGAFGKGDFEAKIPKHTKGLRAGDLVNEMSSDKELSRAVGQFFDGVPIPNFMKKGFTHRGIKVNDSDKAGNTASLFR